MNEVAHAALYTGSLGLGMLLFWARRICRALHRIADRLDDANTLTASQPYVVTVQPGPHQ